MSRQDGTAGRAWPQLPRALVAVVAAVGMATVVASVASNGNPLVTVLPVLVAAGGLALSRLPLRWPAAGLVFLSLALDTSRDAHLGVWKSPFVFLGDLLRENLEKTLLPGVKFSGLEVGVAILLGFAVYRRAVGTDGGGRVQTATVITDFVLLYVASVAFALANGLATGGTFELWQVRYLLQIPVLFVFFRVLFTAPRDLALLGRVVVAAALVKALLSIWIRYNVRFPDGTELDFTTNHGDSILFASAILVLVTHFTERSDRRRLLQLAVLGPVVLWGLKANLRRLGWVDVAMGLGVVFLLSPWSPWKRFVTRAALIAVPIAALYVAVGWNSEGALYSPVRKLRSLVEPQEIAAADWWASATARQDASTYWRDVENWNLVVMMRDNPLRGVGLGKAYRETIRNNDLSTEYSEWRSWPHNSVLGLLLFGGLFAFTGIWSIFAVVIFLALRSYRLAKVPEHRAAALCCVGAVLFCILQAYGDLGAPFTQYQIFTAMALAVAGQLAVATGAWPERRRRVPLPVGSAS